MNSRVRNDTARGAISGPRKNTALFRVATGLLACIAIAARAHDGQLDTSFGATSYTRGTVVLGTGLRYDQDVADAVAIQSDGRIVVAGTSVTDDGDRTTLAVVRLNQDGTQDMDFAGGPTPGAFVYPYGQRGTTASAIALDSMGRIVIGGSYANFDGVHAAIWRLFQDGTLDTSFGDNGMSLFTVDGDLAHTTAIYDLKLNVSDAIYVTGTYDGPGHSQLMLGVLGPDGSVVKITASDLPGSPPGDVVPTRLLVQADGKLAVAGYWKVAGQWLCMDARFNVTLDGSGFHFPLDTTYHPGFGYNGFSRGYSGPAGEHLTDCYNDALLQRADGSYIAAGRTAYDNLGGGWIAQFYRLDANGNLIDNAIVRLSPFGDNSIRNVLEQSDRRVVMSGFTGYDDGQGDTGSGFVAARFVPDLSALDPGYGNNGIGFFKFDALDSSNDQSFAAALDADERVVMAGSSFGGIQSPSNTRFAIARLQSDLIFRNAFELHE
jgi:uncharacterized delta-60 repeat protein